MAKRGRPKKSTTETTVAVRIDHAKLLKQFEEGQRIGLEELYKDLANLKHKVDLALTHVHHVTSCDSLAEAAFKVGRAYDPLDKVNDKLEDMLEDLRVDNNFRHYDHIIDN